MRAHLVAGADPGTPVRVTGWPEDDGVHAELLSAHNLLDSVGVTGPGATLFVALARLTGEPDPLPLAESVSVKVEGEEGGGVRRPRELALGPLDVLPVQGFRRATFSVVVVGDAPVRALA